VRESAEEVLARFIEFRRSVLQGLSLAWDGSASHSPLPAPAPPSEREHGT